MYNSKHYFPILKSKQGEFTALRPLTTTELDNMTPIIEILENDDDDIVTYFTRLVNYLNTNWTNKEKPFFLDFLYLDDNLTFPNNNHYLPELYNILKSQGLFSIPVTDLDHTTSFQNEVAQIIAAQNGEVGIRLYFEEIGDSTNLKNRLDQLITLLQTTRDKIYLIIDLDSINNSIANFLKPMLSNMINNLPYLKDWKNIIISATSFPQNVSHITANTVGRLQRMEWDIFLNIIQNKTNYLRIPNFSDYVISHPDVIDFDPLRMTPSAHIRYTSDTYWVIVRGRSVRTHRFIQYHQLCQTLIGLSEYCGPSFSDGDNYINNCAQGLTGPGSQMIWRRVGTNHHITFVVNQILNNSSI